MRKKRIAWNIAAIAVVMCFGIPALGQNLLSNPHLDEPGPDNDPLDQIPGWTLVEGPNTTPLPPTAPAPANAAEFRNFADHTTLGGGRGLWFRSFLGGLNAEQPDTVFANLTQVVPASPGLLYELSAYSQFQRFFPGGLPNINEGGGPNADPPESFLDGPESPTRLELALEFLDAGNNVLPGSIVRNLADDHTTEPHPNFPDDQWNVDDWVQSVLTGVAPAGTVAIQVRSSMIDGLLNPNVDPQSAFIDDFSLRVVPEPSSVVLALIGMLGVGWAARRRK